MEREGGEAGEGGRPEEGIDGVLRAEVPVEVVARTVPDILYIFDAAKNRNAYTNRELTAVLGYTPAEVRAMGDAVIATLMHPDDAGRMPAYVAERDALPFGAFAEVEYRMRHRDGTWRWLHSRETVLERRQDGAVRRVFGVAQDITARVEAGERLRLLELAAAHADDVLLISEAEPIDLPGPRVLYVNDAFTRMTGYAPEEIIGRTPRLLQGPSTSPETRAFIRERLKAWDSFRCELVNYRKDGTPFWVELYVRPVADESGWYTHWVAVQRDISDRKREQLALEAEADRQGRIARTLQRTLLQTTASPFAPSRPPRVGGVEVYTAYEPADQDDLIGGDFYDAFLLPGGRVALVVGDAMGKGLAAAADTADVKFTLRAFLREDPGTDPAALLGRLNAHLCRRRALEEGERRAAGVPTQYPMVCVSVVVIEPATGAARAAAAGMEPTLVLRAGGGGPPEAVSDAGGLPLGAISEWEGESAPLSRPLAPGDALLLFTDGVAEARRRDGAGGLTIFGAAGVAGAAGRAFAAGPGVPLSSVSDAILGAARAFAGGSLADDVCLLLARLPA